VDDGNVTRPTDARLAPPGHSHEGRSLLRLFCFCTLAGLGAISCSLPQMPGDISWDTHLIIPMGVRTYGLNELAESAADLRQHGSGIGLGPDSVLYFATFTRLTIPLHDSLTFEAVTDTFVKPAGLLDSTAGFALVGQRHHVFRSTITEGTVSLSLTAPDAAPADTVVVQATLLDILINSVGDPLMVTQAVPGGTVKDTALSLVGYQLTMEDSDPQVFHARLHSSSALEVRAIIHTGRLVFHLFNGELNGLALESSNNGVHVEPLPEGWDVVHPTDVSAIIHVERGLTGAVCDFTGRARSFLAGEQIDTADVVVSDANLAADTLAVVNGLAHFVARYPDSVSARGRITISGRVTCYSTDTLRLNVEMHAPLAFTLDTLQPPGEVTRVPNEGLKDVQSGSARIRIWNRLPAGGRVFVVANRDSLDVLPESGAAVDTVADVHIPIPAVVGGRAAETAFAEFTIGLSDSLLELFRHPPFFTRTDIFVPGSGGDTLVAHASDYLKVQVLADVIYRIDTGD
jgi:hypothetical protein